MLNELYVIRDYIPVKDDNLIFDSFLKGVYNGNAFFSLIPENIFFANYRPVLETLLKSPAITVKVACLTDDPDTVLGYSILSVDFQTIHYVYVKKKFRKMGVGKTLVPKYPAAVTHLTALGLELLPKLEGTIFNPFAL